MQKNSLLDQMWFAYKFDVKKNYQVSINIRKLSARNHMQASPTAQTKIASRHEAIFFLVDFPVPAQMNIAMPFNLLISDRYFFFLTLDWDFFVLTAVRKLDLCLSFVCFNLFPTQQNCF